MSDANKPNTTKHMNKQIAVFTFAALIALVAPVSAQNTCPPGQCDMSYISCLSTTTDGGAVQVSNGQISCTGGSKTWTPGSCGDPNGPSCGSQSCLAPTVDQPTWTKTFIIQLNAGAPANSTNPADYHCVPGTTVEGKVGVVCPNSGGKCAAPPPGK